MKRLAYSLLIASLGLAACSPKAEPESPTAAGVVREVKDGAELASAPAAAAAPGACVRAGAKGLSVRWRAFKTPKKAKVEGILKDIKSDGPETAETWQKLVLAQTLSIGAGEGSVDSGDPVRDAKLAKFFFANMTGPIAAKATRIDEAAKKLYLDLTMNGKTVSGAAMDYVREGETLKAKGKIDVLDFGASKALAAINEACSEKHEGKTWSDVEIGLEAELKACS